MNDAAHALPRVGSNREDRTILAHGGVAILKCREHALVSEQATQPILDLPLARLGSLAGLAKLGTRRFAQLAAWRDHARDLGVERGEIGQRPSEVREARRRVGTGREKTRDAPRGAQRIENLCKVGAREQSATLELLEYGPHVLRAPERQLLPRFEQSTGLTCLGQSITYTSERLLELERQTGLGSTLAACFAREPLAHPGPLEPLEDLGCTAKAHNRGM